MTDRLVNDGYLSAGYNTISIDDCWGKIKGQKPRRDEQGRQIADPERFPSGMKALGRYMHERGVKFGLYSDVGKITCGGFEGSLYHEVIDAKTYADWGVDYLKLDGCYNDKKGGGYAVEYPTMGNALRASRRDIVFSCSWPAYLGSNESNKPFDAMIDAGCNTWRNFVDVSNRWGSVSRIIDHWGDYSDVLTKNPGRRGYWHDMDMILAGNDHWGSVKLTLDQAKVQLSIWSICASPLIMSNDLRTVPEEYKVILLNREMISVNQDAEGRMGGRTSRHKDGGEVWTRHLSKGRLAIVLYNRNLKNVISIEADISALSEKFYGVKWDAVTVRDVWNTKYIGMHRGTFTAMGVNPTACVFVVVGPVGSSNTDLAIEEA